MTTSEEERNYAMGVLAAKGAMRDGMAFAAICEQAEAVLAKETPRDEVRRLRAALKPFAELADSYSDSFDDKTKLLLHESNDGDSTSHSPSAICAAPPLRWGFRTEGLMQQKSQREMAHIIADSTSMSGKELRAMSTIVLMAAEVALARETGKTYPAPAPTDG